MAFPIPIDEEIALDLQTAVRGRRAVKHFDPQHAITEQEIQEIMSLVLLSPTAFNIQHWRFVLVRDPALREAIRAVSWMQAQITEASLLVIVCADIGAWKKEPHRYWRNADPDTRDGIVEAITEYYNGREQVQRDEAMRSCGIAAQTMMLAARAAGYDSCPMDLADFEAVAQLIHLPPDHAIGLFVVLGKGRQEPRPRGGQLSFDEVVLIDRF